MTVRGVGALILDREAQARVRAALACAGHGGAPGGVAVEFHATGASLLAAVRERRLAAVVLEPRDGAGLATDATVRAIRRGYPSLPVIAYVLPGRACSADILALARAGVHELVLRGVDDVGIALRAAVSSAVRQSVAERVLREAAPLVGTAALEILRYCLEHAAEAPTIHGVARALGVHRKTLVNRMRAASLPPPRALLGWCRLLVAAELLDDPARPVEQVALELDFPSGTAFRNMLRRYTALGPREVRENGGLECVLHAFKRALVAGRDADRPAAPMRRRREIADARPPVAARRTARAERTLAR
jgi:AraC-like DNA-binding protein